MSEEWTPARRQKEITCTWHLLFTPGQIVELRAPKAGRYKTVSGYFDNPKDLAKAVAAWDEQVSLYVSLNVVNPALFARSANKAQPYAETTTSDADILRRRWLPIDLDPVRPSGISSSDAEHEAALKRLSECATWLREAFGIEGVQADSGNGAHLLLPIDLPNDEASALLCQRVLEALASRFDDNMVCVDRTMFNAARICKLYGTKAVKGCDTPDRPHRVSRLLHVPETLRPVPVETLAAIAALLPEMQEEPQQKQGKTFTRGRDFDVRQWMQEHSIRVHRELPYKGGTKFQLEQCPFDPSHESPDAAVFRGADGKLGFKCLHNSCAGRNWHALREYLEPGWQEKKAQKGKTRADKSDEEEVEAEEKTRESAAQRLVAIGQTCELFHSDRDEGFARVTINGHKECWPLRSKGFRDWLAREYHSMTDKVPGSQAVQDALSVLEGDARFDGVERPLSVRVAADPTEPDVIWIDLANAAWQAVKVTPNDWEIVNDPPPLFRRYGLSAPHVLPERGGNLEMLRDFLNVKDDNAWYLLVAWLVAGLLPHIAHPILVTHGEQGSAKSTMTKLLALLLDPSKTPLRSEPRDIAEWVQAADHAWMVSLDNVSTLPPWLSDALCRAVTGEGFSKRMLYTDNDDIILCFRRVIALTGVEVVASRPDLLDRSILLGLLPISPTERRSENEVLTEFEKVRPQLFGALLDVLCEVLRQLPQVRLTEMPRMADFARVGVAVERALLWPDNAFLDAYTANVSEQHEEALSASLVGDALRAFLSGKSEWTGTAKELLEKLTEKIGDGKARQRDWPKNARGLSGQLRRIAPNLRAVGVWIEFAKRTEHARLIQIRKTEQAGEQPSEPSVPSE